MLPNEPLRAVRLTDRVPAVRAASSRPIAAMARANDRPAPPDHGAPRPPSVDLRAARSDDRDTLGADAAADSEPVGVAPSASQSATTGSGSALQAPIQLAQASGLAPDQVSPLTRAEHSSDAALPSGASDHALAATALAFGALLAHSAQRKPTPPATVAIKVVDGYVSGAQIYLDSNRDGIAGPDEALAGTETDQTGTFRVQDTLSGEAFIAVGGVNSDTQVPNRLPLLAPPGATVLTPLTTLAHKLMLEGRASTSEAASSRVLAGLGLHLPDGASLTHYDPLLANDLELQRAGAAIAVLLDFASDGDPTIIQTVLRRLATVVDDAASDVERGGSPVTLSTAEVLDDLVHGLVAAPIERAALAQSMSAILSAHTMTELSSLQAQALSYLALAQPDLSTLDASDDIPQLVIVGLGASTRAADDNGSAPGDTLELALYQNNQLLGEHRYTLSESDIAAREVVLPIPPTLAPGAYRLTALLKTARGWTSALDTEYFDVTTDNPQHHPDTTPPIDPAPGTPTIVRSGSDFNYHDALTSAVFSEAAYQLTAEIASDPIGWKPLSSIGWRPLDPTSPQHSVLQADNARAVAARHDSAAEPLSQFIIGFKGSSSLEDWGNNVFQFGWTHYYQLLMPLVAQVIDAALTAQQDGRQVQLILTGHSLGGAAATLAFADLFAPPDTNFWNLPDAPLGRSERIHQYGLLETKWTDAQIEALADHATVYTFGAPSFLIDPNKLPTAPVGLLERAQLLLFSGLEGLLADALTVRDADLPPLAGYADQAFQFEHINSDRWRSDDLVAKLGSRQPGTELVINLDEAVYDRYGQDILFGLAHATTPIDLHGIDRYIESVARAITGSALLKSDNPESAKTPLLPEVDAGTPGSDFLRNVSADALAGDDILLAEQPGDFRFKGGPGDDLYVVSAYGANVTIDGLLDGLDRLYFALDGDISATNRVAPDSHRVDRVFTISRAGQAATAIVLGWDADPSGGVNLLDFVGQIVPSSDKNWSFTGPAQSVL